MFCGDPKVTSGGKIFAGHVSVPLKKVITSHDCHFMLVNDIQAFGVHKGLHNEHSVGQVLFFV